MVYRLIYTKTAARDIQKLDSVAKRRIGNKLKEYSKSPLTYAKKLTDPKIGMYRWRIGNYRIVFDIEGNNLVILRVGHRKEIYR